MSEEIVEIKANDSISKNSISKRDMKKDINMNLNSQKTLCKVKKIAFISLLIMFIFGLFFFTVCFFISKNSKKKSNLVNEPSRNLDEFQKAENLKEIKQIQIQPMQQIEDNVLLKPLPVVDPLRPVPKGELEGQIKQVQFIKNEILNFSIPFPFNRNYTKKILLVTNHFSKNKNSQNRISSDVIYKILLEIKIVNLTVLDAYDPTLENKTIAYFKQFNLVVIDLIDGGYSFFERSKNFTKALIQYVKEGGALFTGHDQFDSTHKRFITQEALDMLKLLGLTHKNSWGVGGGSTVYFDYLALRNSIFLANLALYGDSIKIAYTHQTYSKFDSSCQTCNVILKFVKNGSNDYEYLITNRPNRIGKTVNVRAGHSTDYTEAEKKIFLSSILWLLYDI